MFNTEYTDEQGCHRWRPSSKKIQFPEGKTWKDYVRDNRLEITCGEAPYIVSDEPLIGFVFGIEYLFLDAGTFQNAMHFLVVERTQAFSAVVYGKFRI